MMPSRTPVCLALAAALLLPLTGCVQEAGSETHGPVSAEAERPPKTHVRVRVAQVRRDQLGADERVAGTVRAFHSARVTAEAQGRVLRRHVERGDEVEAGQLLLELDASRLELRLLEAEQNLRARLSDLGHARREHERAEKLATRAAISEQLRDDLQHRLEAARNDYGLALVARDTAQRLLDDASIEAPIAGTVDDLFVNTGDFVNVGTPVAHVLDFSRARIFGGVTAREAANLAPGVEARAHFADLGGLEQRAEFRSVARAADPRDGTYAIELWISDPDPRLRDGMIASLVLSDTAAAPTALAPRAALMRRNGRSEVFVVEPGSSSEFGTARGREVRTGRSSGDWVEILDGLREGEQVVIDGQFALRDGMSVKLDGIEAPKRGTPATAQAQAAQTLR